MIAMLAFAAEHNVESIVDVLALLAARSGRERRARFAVPRTVCAG